MPDVLTAGDALREYLTGAVSPGAAQPDQALSLGGYRSAERVVCNRHIIGGSFQNIKLGFVSGANPNGLGRLVAVTNSRLTWTAPQESTQGEPVEFTGTQTKVIEADSDAGKFVIVTARPPFDIGANTVTVYDAVNNVYAMTNEGDGSGTGSGTGSSEVANRYRCVCLRNVSSGTLTDVKRWIASLATGLTSEESVLGVSGSGEIGFTPSGTGTAHETLTDWPLRGWARIKTAGGLLREVVYYRRRTDDTLFVPTYGRGRLGTTPSAGALTDQVVPVPGIAIGADPVGVVNPSTPCQTLSDEFTPPTGVSWSLSITSTDAVTFGTMATGKLGFLWLWREVPIGASASPACRVRINGSFGY